MSRRRRSRALHHKALARDKRDSVVPLEAPAAPASHVGLVAAADDVDAPASGALELANAATEAAPAEELTQTPPPVSTTAVSAVLAPSSVSATTMAASFEAEEDPMPSFPPARLDEGSLPPLTSNLDDAGDEHEELFFDKKVVVAAHDADEDEVEDPAARALREANERRAAERRFNSRKYVAAVVGLCALVGALGFSQRFVGSKSASAKNAVSVAAAAQPAEQTQALMPLPAIELQAPPAAAQPVAAAPVAPAPPKAEDVPHPDDVTIPVKEEPKVDAKAEKRAAQRSLESGKVGDAIEHASASVKADETDAEAWLLLGASYQEKGQLAKAREAFVSCTKVSTHGPKGECAAMLR